MNLPKTWVWTRRAFGPERALWAARDMRWPASCPEVVGVGSKDVARTAWECDSLERRIAAGRV